MNSQKDKRVMMKIHSYGGSTVLAACDPDLLGEVLRHGDIRFPVSRDFYDGDLVNGNVLCDMIRKVRSANLIGKRCIDIVLDHGIIEESSVVEINGIPHTQIYDVSEDGGIE